MLFEKQLIRILEIEENHLGSNPSDEHCRLVNQFLKLAATTLKKLGSEIQSPHFEPREVFGVGISLDQELTAKLREKFGMSFFAYQVVSRHLRLAKLSETNDDALAYSDLYEPLIKVLEDGGLLDLDRGDIVVDGKWTAPVRNFRERCVPETPD